MTVQRSGNYAKNRHHLKNTSPWCCGLCGHLILQNELTVDHIIPVSRGGDDELMNLRLVHNRCNLIKGNMLDTEFPILIKFYFFWKKLSA